MGSSQRVDPHRTIVDRPGLQAERTDLSWTRTSLAFIVNGALLLLRREASAPSHAHLIAVAIAFALAMFAYFMAHQRRRALTARPLPESLAAPMSLWLLGAGTVLLGLISLVVIWIG